MVTRTCDVFFRNFSHFLRAFLYFTVAGTSRGNLTRLMVFRKSISFDKGLTGMGFFLVAVTAAKDTLPSVPPSLAMSSTNFFCSKHSVAVEELSRMKQMFR